MRSTVLTIVCVLALIEIGIFSSPGLAEQPATTITWATNLPIYDHIVIVVEENKDYTDIIGQPEAPYINNVLKKEGASLTRMFGEEHNSQGNYFWLFSGSNQSVGFVDVVPNARNHQRYPFTTSNLASQLMKNGRTFKGYSEDLPSIGFTGEHSSNKLYARKHAPWISFSNVPNGSTVETSANLRWSDFPTDPAQFPSLPTVAFVIPNLVNDMHDGPTQVSVATGDRWLKRNLDNYYQWAKKNNSLLIVTFDENDDKKQYRGLTDPFIEPKNENDELAIDKQNRIATILAGAHIQPGEYSEGMGVTHVNILRTIEAMYGLPKSGAQQPKAAAGGITDDAIITDVFVPTK